MAAIDSLGLHEPSALSYLVSEGYLSAAASPHAYKWNYQQGLDGNSRITDEILQTADCVVWSRNGAIRRVFNLDIEEETIQSTFITCFQRQEPPNGKSQTTRVSSHKEFALVVILTTQIHIFPLSGDTHVVPLSFRVHRAFPAAQGFLLQRHIARKPTDQVLADYQKSNLGNDSLLTDGHGRLDELVRAMLPTLESRPGESDRISTLPRTYAFSEILSELGLVVEGSPRKHESYESCPVLQAEEEIIYVSPNDELHELQLNNSEHIYLAITTNTKANTLTLWQMVFRQAEDTSQHGRYESAKHTSRRKSSNAYGRQNRAETPNTRSIGTFRESLGAASQAIQASGVFARSRDADVSQAGDLVTQLGHEFDQVGVQTRSARRVSSMLARTDLGAANDRSAFNEITLGGVGRKSFGRSMRRGESLGGFSDRQSFGMRRRSSFQAASSIYSDGTSFLDMPANQHLHDSVIVNGTDANAEPFNREIGGTLPRDVAFLKLKTLAYELSQVYVGEESSLKVTTLLAPDRSTADDRRSRLISVCIMDKRKGEMTIVNIAAKTTLSINKHRNDRIAYDLKAVEVQRGQSIVDACSLVEDDAKRLLILTRTRDGQSVLHLEAPWSVSYRLSLPAHLKIFSLSDATRYDSPVSRRDTGIRRIIPGSEIEWKSLQRCEQRDQVLAFDTEGRYHRLRFRLMPSQMLVRQILQICNFVLPPEFVDCMLVAWWEVKRWIEAQASEPKLEWTALVVTLFVLAVPFIGSLQTRPAQGPRRKKGGLLRSSSGTTVDLANWNHMRELGKSSTLRQHDGGSCWMWLDPDKQHKIESKSPNKHSRTTSSDSNEESKADAFLIRCINLARDFLQSPAGESATGPEGYLPIAINKERSCRRTALASILVGLHLLREEYKLHEISSGNPDRVSNELAPVIIQIGSWLRWQEWRAEPGQYYYTDIENPAQWLVDPSNIDGLDVPAQPFPPPSIFEHVEKVIMDGRPGHFPSLLDLVSQTKPIMQNNPLWKQAARLTSRLFAVVAFMEQLNPQTKARTIVKQMFTCGIDTQILNTLPVGIAAVCYQAIVTLKEKSPAYWSREMQALFGQADANAKQAVYDLKSGANQVSHVHDATRDFRTISNNSIEADSVSRWDFISEIDRQAITKLIFQQDRRFQEASKLVNQTRPPVVECTPEPGWSEADLLEAQKELAVYVTRRTLAVAAGRAIMHFNARTPLLTERVPIPAFSLQCIMRAQNDKDNSQSMTLSADKALFTEDKVCWAFFHNGASAGLMISRETRWIDTSWILYNKPPELTNRHAGFLLALGLNGHLKSLAKWVAFKYLTPKHTMTSVGLLLGLAASYLGTMDTLIARLLSVHVTRLLPVGAAELNLSPLTQTTGIMGVGLLYCNSQHRRMSEIMLSEIENSDAEELSSDETMLRDEGYRLAAGFSLGLINLGQGKRLHSLHDMNVVERLLTIAIGTKNVNLVHVLDRATAGAVVAVAFIFMKTNDETIAQKIDIPDTTHQFDYVRPDIFLLRTLAKHLIMWDNITPTRDFVRASLPSVFRKRADLSTTKRLSTDDLPCFNVIAGICFAMSLRYAGSHRHDVRDLLVLYLDQFLRLIRLPSLNYDAKVTLNGIRNCLDVLALSCATVMAGSGDIEVMRRLRALHGRTDKDTPFGSHLAAHMALGVLFLSGGTATFGTSNTAVAALVISLYPLFPVDVLDNKGHLQALRHLWVLAVENRCLVVRDAESQQVLSDIEVGIELKNGTKLRLKTPGLLPEFESIHKVVFNHENYWPFEVNFDSPSRLSSSSNEVHLSEKRKHNLVRDELKASGMGLRVRLQRRAASERPDTDIFFSELQALDEARGVPSIDPNAATNTKWRQVHGHGATTEMVQTANPLDWVFQVNTFKHFDFAEKALVMDDFGSSHGEGQKMLSGTTPDSTLDLEIGSMGIDNHAVGRADGVAHSHTDRDKLWQLRLVFDWVDRWQKEEEMAADRESHSAAGETSMKWMKDEFIEQLRWRVWQTAGGK